MIARKTDRYMERDVTSSLRTNSSWFKVNHQPNVRGYYYFTFMFEINSSLCIHLLSLSINSLKAEMLSFISSVANGRTLCGPWPVMETRLIKVFIKHVFIFFPFDSVPDLTKWIIFPYFLQIYAMRCGSWFKRLSRTSTEPGGFRKT